MNYVKLNMHYKQSGETIENFVVIASADNIRRDEVIKWFRSEIDHDYDYEPILKINSITEDAYYGFPDSIQSVI